LFFLVFGYKKVPFFRKVEHQKTGFGCEKTDFGCQKTGFGCEKTDFIKPVFILK